MEKEKKSKKEKSFTVDALNKIINLIVLALGLVAALAWNEAIQALFSSIFGKRGTLLTLFGYALLITFIVIIITIQLKRFLKLAEEKEKKLKEKIKSVAVRKKMKKD